MNDLLEYLGEMIFDPTADSRQFVVFFLILISLT